MSPLELYQLQQCPDIASLQAVLRRMCARFGTVTQLRILPAAHAGKHQALCFVRMASEDEEQKLMSGLGIGRFGGELVVVVELRVIEPQQTADLWSSAA